MQYKYDQFSKYRRELMGIAILLIMYGHNTFIFPGFLKNINSGLMMLGQSAVILHDKKLVIALITSIYMFFFLNHFGIIYFKGAFVIVEAIFITRIPAFLIGSIFAQKSLFGEKINNQIVHVVIALGVISSAICLVMYKLNVRNYWILIRLLFIFVIFVVMFLWIMVREQNMEYNAVISTLIRLFSFLGPITLEIYLTHENILGLMKRGISGLESIGLIYNVSAFAVSIVLSYFLHKLMNFSQKK